MKTQDYHSSITTTIDPKKAFESISRVPEWWTSHFEGRSQNPGDVFTVRFGETFVTFKVTEVVPGQKVSWLVTDCNLHWLSDKKEWKDTRIVWEVSTRDNLTQIDFTHIGLVPAVECYENCEKGWNFFIKDSLFKLITEDKGLPDAPREVREKALETAG